MNGADRLCDLLLANDVDVCFANPGTSEMHFVAALDRKPEMRCVLGLFEGVVTGAADGYARMAGKPAATLLHLGPGLGNGLANLHNARRAETPMINIVGDHATYHLQYDAPLTSDIESIARPMSNWVRTIASVDAMDRDTGDAYAAAVSLPGVATLILPADVAWSPAAETPVERTERPLPAAISEELLGTVIDALRSDQRVMIMLSGTALRAEPLRAASAIAAKTKARLMAQTSNARMERGAGRVTIEKLPYRIDLAVETMRDVDVLVLIGAIAPAAFFAYPSKPGVPYRDDCDVIHLASSASDLPALLSRMAHELGATEVPSPSSPGQPTAAPEDGALTGESVCRMVARAIPEGAVICDESISSGASFYGLSHESAPHDYLELTGGAIGVGIPLSLGASLACPDRKVICLQADGSGMYTVQGLWSQARENADVLTIVLANRTYGTLHFEMRNVGVNQFGENASMMLNLDKPDLDWVSLAKGMGVDGGHATTVAEFASLLKTGLARKGPFLIQASI
ncbi:acetolactate synthase large subunit [Microvirga antarctica]|uniref:acetolactate synthase large subunit n=1 Tax=Microvirga antarctica TaxID=2819233 RepID=UPI001B304BB6|nr:acetolactate synthase large subunit [Microvirga antarctica]